MKHLLLTTIAAVLLVGCGNPEADRALLEAARDGNIEAVRQHLAAGADVNVNDQRGYGGSTPLHVAAQEGHNQVIELLIDNGANVNAKRSDGATPLDWAEDEPKIADLLREHGGKHGSIHTAAAGGDTEAVKEFLAAGTDVNAKNQLGRTPLHAAAYRGHTVVVELLVANDADVNALSVNGKTPLDWAETVYEGVQPEYKAAYEETVDLLRKHGGKTGEELRAPDK